MGKSLALMAGIASAASAVGSIVSGIQQNNAAQDQANLAQREAEDRARIEARENIEAEKRQKVAFLNSGVSLSGSPMVVLAETRSRGDANIDATITSGETRASSIRDSGRQALIGGVTKAAGTAVTGFQNFKGS